MMRYLLLTFGFILTNYAQVSQVDFKVLPNKQLEITYQLTQAGTISAQAILDGNTIPIKTVTGHIGENIQPGHKRMTWNVRADVESLIGELEIEVACIIPKIVGEYKTVKIGNQTWLAENLNIEIEGSSCYDDDPANCEKYGRLYTWEAAKKIADQIPGWHLPTDEEWKTLEKSLGMSQSAADDGGWRGSPVGIKLKKGGSSGFDALLVVLRYSGGCFFNLGNYGNFWSASPLGSSYAWDRYVFASDSNVSRGSNDRTNRFSVRLIKDK